MQGADEGRSRKKVSWASVNAAYTSLEVRDEVAASSRAELKEVVMSSAEQRNNIVLYAKTGSRWVGRTPLYATVINHRPPRRSRFTEMHASRRQVRAHLMNVLTEAGAFAMVRTHARGGCGLWQVNIDDHLGPATFS